MSEENKVALAKKPLRQCRNVQEMLMNDMAQAQLRSVAAEHMKPERMMRLMANSVRTTPKIAECEPLSLLGAMMTCASLGLEPNTALGHAYLIPFKNSKKKITEVQLVIGYKGMIDLARRSGHVVNIHADVVYESDQFSFEYGSNQHLKHIPSGTRDKPTHAYCHAKLTDGEAFIVIPYEEILKTRDSSQGYKTAKKYNKTDNPWIAHEHAMARKTAVRALFNELPVSIEKVTDALQIDDKKADFSKFAMAPEISFPEGDTIDGEAEELEPVSEPPTKPEKKADKEPEPQEPQKEPDAEPDNPDFSTIVSNIKGEFENASDLGAVEAVIELYGAQISEMGGTPAFDDVMAAADERREALAK